ncbi:hypothetical protein GGR50DRAFT_560209 [Xylaria sp. CBS 124048]|nr:hypothetical protein GGR50DRAFT_560209 [Xylaria sp. CBS 124048]
MAFQYSPSSDLLDISGEKRRNRLGYVRTSMACGNCRKRKIRCLRVKDDGRCVQCIRLRKNCQFYAVDQEPVPSTGSKVGSRLLPKTTLATTSMRIAPKPVETLHAFYDRTAAGHGMRSPVFETDTQFGNHTRQYEPPSRSPVVSLEICGDSPYGHIQDTDNSALMAEQGNINAFWRGYSSDSPVLAPDCALYAAPISPASMGWTVFPVEATGLPEGAPLLENMWSSYREPVRPMSFDSEYPVQYGDCTTQDDGKVSGTYHRPSTEMACHSPRQQPFQHARNECGGHSCG